MKNGARYDSLYHRLVSNIHEPANEQSCWYWQSKLCKKGGYPRLNVYVPALADKRTVQAHVALYVCMETQPKSMNDFYLAYLELTTSGLELDHRCRERACINPDHLDLTTASVNCKRKRDRWA